MAIDYSQLANVVRAELQHFLSTVQHVDNEHEHQTATEQLWAVITRVDEFAYAPSDAQWDALSETQRWGYLRLESYIGTALHELRQRQPAVWQVPHSPRIKDETNKEPLYA